MLKMLLIAIFSLNANAFTLNPTTGRGFNNNKISINIAANDCSGAGFSTSKLASMVKSAIKDYWNKVPTSSLKLKSNGVNSSIDIDGDQFSDALNKTATNTIVAGCNDDVTDFSNTSILGAAVMECNGSACKAVLILNSISGSALNTMSTSEITAVIAHEIGHAIGLGHSEYTYSLMYYAAGGKKQEWLGEDDIDGVSYLYPHDAQLMGLIGSCGTITSATTDNQKAVLNTSHFLASFLFGVLLVWLTNLLNGHFLNKFIKNTWKKSIHVES